MADLKKAELVQWQGRDVMTSEIYFVEEFMSFLGDPKITISAFIDDDPLHRIVQLSGFVNERYRILIDLNVKFSISEKLSVTAYSHPEIHVNVISNISRLGDGRYKLEFSNSYKIDEARVNDFLSKNISLSDFMRHLLDDKQSIKGFKEYIEWRNRGQNGTPQGHR